MKTERYSLIYACVVLLISCQKEKIESYPEFIGEWEYATIWECENAYLTPYLTIEEDGYATFRGGGRDSKGKVKIKDSILFIGTRKLEIAEFPKEHQWLIIDIEPRWAPMNQTIRIGEPVSLLGGGHQYVLGRFTHEPIDPYSELEELNGHWFAQRDGHDFTLSIDVGRDTFLLLETSDTDSVIESMVFNAKKANATLASFSKHNEAVYFLSGLGEQIIIRRIGDQLSLDFGLAQRFGGRACSNPGPLPSDYNGAQERDLIFTKDSL